MQFSLYIWAQLCSFELSSSHIFLQIIYERRGKIWSQEVTGDTFETYPFAMMDYFSAGSWHIVGTLCRCKILDLKQVLNKVLFDPNSKHVRNLENTSSVYIQKLLWCLSPLYFMLVKYFTISIQSVPFGWTQRRNLVCMLCGETYL